MNRQRKVIITITYNDLGIIVDTKAEELDLSSQQNLQPTCNNLATDAISRQAAIDACEQSINILDAMDRIRDLPPAQSDPQWIPCSPETMPKKTSYYLVQYTRKYCRNEMAVAFYSVEEARCDDDYTWEIETFSDIKEVIAWMPLPEPYREEGERK